MVYKTTILQK
jgi:hypothetical protein